MLLPTTRIGEVLENLNRMERCDSCKFEHRPTSLAESIAELSRSALWILSFQRSVDKIHHPHQGHRMILEQAWLQCWHDLPSLSTLSVLTMDSVVPGLQRLS